MTMSDTFNHQGLDEEGDYAVLLIEDGRWTTHCYVSREYAAAKAEANYSGQPSFSRKVDGLWTAYEPTLAQLDLWIAQVAEQREAAARDVNSGLAQRDSVSYGR